MDALNAVQPIFAINAQKITKWSNPLMKIGMNIPIAPKSPIFVYKIICTMTTIQINANNATKAARNAIERELVINA